MIAFYLPCKNQEILPMIKHVIIYFRRGFQQLVLIFQFLNLIGAILLIINSIYKQVYPFTFINSVWTVIAVVAIVGIVKKKRITN